MRWHKPNCLDTLDDDWESWPSTGGVYLIMGPRALRRAVSTDRHGILYIGQARNLRNRLWDAWYAQHPGTGMLWDFPQVAAALLGSRSGAIFDREQAIGRLKAKLAYPIPPASLDRCERALLFAYFYRYAELPPLNACMPKRWNRVRPGKKLIRWALRGIVAGG